MAVHILGILLFLVYIYFIFIAEKSESGYQLKVERSNSFEGYYDSFDYDLDFPNAHNGNYLGEFI